MKVKSKTPLEEAWTAERQTVQVPVAAAETLGKGRFIYVLRLAASGVKSE
jgi:hypothetical protein